MDVDLSVIFNFGQLAVILGGPLVGKLMDHFPRVHAYNSLSFVQVILLFHPICYPVSLSHSFKTHCIWQVTAQLMSVAMIIHAHNFRVASVSSVLLRPWFITLVFAGAIERLCGLALGVAMERDWLVLVIFFFRNRRLHCFLNPLGV